MSRLSKYTVQGLVVLGAGLLAACSLLYDLSADQCEIDADCAAIGLPGRCVAGVCTPTNMQTGGTGGGGGSEAGTGGCKTNKDCLGEETIIDPSVCIEGECVDLTTEECPVVLPLDEQRLRASLTTGSAIVFGAFAPFRSDLSSVPMLNYDLAFTEFSQVNGLPPVGSGGRRPVIGVVCQTPEESDGDFGKIDRSMEHLVDRLRVPGIIGGLHPEHLQHAFDSKGLDAQVFFVSPGESERQLVATRDDGLMWHLLPGGADIAVSYPAALDRVIRYLETTSAIDPGEPVRVALVTADNRFLNQVREVIQDTLRFNGKSPSENEEDGNWLSIVIPFQGTDLGDYTEAVVDFRPHVIIGNAFIEFLFEMMPGIETLWPSGQARPFYMLSPFHYLPGLDLNSVIGLNSTMRRRIIGMNAPSAEDHELYDDYIKELKLRYRDDAQEGYENFYDAAYFLIYSAAAADKVPVLTGADLARGMLRLLHEDGAEVKVGGKHITKTLDTMLQSDPPRVRLLGTLGPPDFTSNGARKGPASIWCISSTAEYVADVLRYDAESDEFYGDFSCFPDF